MPDTHARTGEITSERLPPLTAPPPLALTEISPPAAACANCGTPLAGPYCARCGQRVADFHRSVWRFAAEFFDNAICWDNKLLLTLEPLFKQPGFLTREFMLGRRVRYVHPLRLFLFTSAVCLTLLQYTHSSLVHVDARPDKAHKAGAAHANLGAAASPAPAPDPVNASPPATAPGKEAGAEGRQTTEDDDHDPAGDAIKRAVAENLARSGKDGEARINAAADAMERATARLNEPGGRERFSRAMTDGVQQRLSWVALALLPIFALILRSAYWRNDSFYFEHLIFSLHYHTFLLLYWTVYVWALVVASHLPLSALFMLVTRLGLLLPPVYLFMALRRMYGEGPKRTMAKVVVVGSMHLLAIVIGVAAVGAASFFAATK